MPVTKVKSRWDSNGDLLFEASDGTDLLKIADSLLEGNFATGGLKVNSTAITSTAAELNKLDTVTAVAADFNAIAGSAGNGLVTGDMTKLAALTATAVEINELDGMIAGFTFAFAQGASNITEVTITAVDADGATVASPSIFKVWLSDAATGVGVTSTAASGTVQAKSASGTDFEVMIAKKALEVQALATGIYILEITDSAKTAFYIAAQTPHGEVKISAQLASGDYGA